ncbi:MAG: hypothetical protein AUI47_00595 [Acidobacteria bacterium 13_1_40CM_2_68_5]|nr:MAG: hypothetical protein AUI47_00595 [Acidobacteria bacterium 13_1_40CM_2_68_5]
MRCAIEMKPLVLALAVLVLTGGTAATAGGRLGVRGSVVVGRPAVIVRPVFYDPFFWDPFWYPRFGWGVYSSYGPASYYGYAQIPPRDAAPVELHVKPRKATVIVDGTVVGQARDFSSQAYPMWLKAGTHQLELSCRGYQTLRVKFEAKRGRAYRVHYELNKGQGIDPRSSRAPQTPPDEPGSR